jgi:TRAP-type mannitol/chloroaromatic compound transport system permease large subunit
MADQLGRSVGDMYAGAFVPGFILTGLYAGYVLLITLVRPQAAPALPLEARSLREPNGNSGVPSLLALIAVVGAVGYFMDAHFEAQLGDKAPILAAVVAIIVAFVVAFANRGLKAQFRVGALSRMAERVVFVLVPPLALIFLVLGTIFLGVATPTEGGAMGAAGALILAFVNRRLSFSLLKQAMDSTAKLTSFVVFILVGSTVFSLVFRGVNGDLWVENLLLGLPGGQLGFLIVVNLLVFVLAFFLDFFELAFIVIPLLKPVAEKLGIDLIWFGVLLGVNMQTSFMHPPFGFALFYLRSVAPVRDYIDKITGKRLAGVTTMQIYWGAVPFVCIQVIMVGLVLSFPNLVLSSLDKSNGVDPNKIQIDIPLPNSGGSGSGDPPPINFK